MYWYWWHGSKKKHAPSRTDRTVARDNMVEDESRDFSVNQ